MAVCERLWIVNVKSFDFDYVTKPKHTNKEYMYNLKKKKRYNFK